MPVSRRDLVLYGVVGIAAAVAIVFGLNEVYGFLNSSAAIGGSQRTATVTRGIVQASVSASGNVGVADSADADFATSGTLTAVDVAVGDHVKPGQVLAKIDPTTARNTLMSAQANLDQAESSLATAKQGLTSAQQDSNTSSLQQGELGVTTDEQQLSADETTLATAKAQLKSDQDLSCPALSSSGSSSALSSGTANSGSSGTGSSATSGSGSSSTGTSGSSTSSGAGSTTSGNGLSGNGAGATTNGGGATTGANRTEAGVAVLERSAAGAPGTNGDATGATPGTTDATGATGTTAAGTTGTTGATGTGTGATATGATATGTTATGATGTTGSGATGTTGTGTTASGTTGTGSTGSGASGSASASSGGGSSASSTSPAVTGQASAVGPTTVTLTGSVDPGGADTKYWFEYGTSATALSHTTTKLDAGSGSESVPVSVEVSGLKAGQSYLFHLVASNASATSDGNLELFTTATPSSASTGQASSVSATGVSLSGEVSPTGLATNYYFEYGTSPAALVHRTRLTGAGSGTASVPVSVALSGLTPNTNYLFRLVAVNAAGTSDGSLGLFRTAGASEAVTTGSASTVGATGATLTGSVDPAGLATRYWFAYGTSATRLDHATSKVDAGSGSTAVPVSANVDALKPGATYYFQLEAANLSGTSDGAEETLTTNSAAAPAVESGSASGEMTGMLTLNATVDPGGSDTTYWFEYGTTSHYGRTTKATDAGSGTEATSVSATVSGLRPNTEYLFRIVARNAFGVVDGIGQVAKTAESSCTTDAQTVTSDEQTVQRAEATVTSAKESLAQTEATIASSEQPDSSTIAADEASVAQDEATVADDRKALDQTTLTAPIAGVVTAVNDAVGATVGGSGSSVTSASASSSSSSGSSGSAATAFGATGSGSGSSGSSSSSSGFISIDALDHLEIVAGFAEADATQIALGQAATITFPALTNVEVAGKVVAVSNTSTVVSNVVTYNETIELINPPAAVKEGMTADVNVIDQTANDTLELPSSAITTTGTRSTVELLVNGKSTVTPVVTGIVGNSDTQIVSGLKQGDVVVEPTVSITAATSSSSSTGTGGFGGLTGGGGGFAGLGGGGGGVFRNG